MSDCGSDVSKGEGSSFLAHSRNQFGVEDPLRAHLDAVARRAADFASAFGAADEARLAGLLHDLGKYGDLFQERLRRRLPYAVDHTSAGAWYAYAMLGNRGPGGAATALAIQGHHLGLQQADQDELERLDLRKLSARHSRDVRVSEPDLDILLGRFRSDGLQLPDDGNVLSSLYDPTSTLRAATMLDMRMLFSALVDADFIETERHFYPQRTRAREETPELQPDKAYALLGEHIQRVATAFAGRASVGVMAMRGELLDACVKAAEQAQGLFTLTAPTGSGKTLSMLAFALKHAARHNLRRVVYVAPYLTIIEQTVREYRRVFDGHLPDGYLLEQHSLAGTHGEDDDREGRGVRNAQRLRAENWSAPVVLTTSVQMLESLFSNRPSACRKLHRLAKSVIVFDEVQTLPTGSVGNRGGQPRPDLAVPTLATLSRLVERYGATVVFATATQPAFGHLDEHVRKWCACGWQPTKIVPDELAVRLFERARRTEVRWPDLDSTTSWNALASRLASEGCRQVLCVVNLKQHAVLLFARVRDRLGDDADLFHLSTNMCPAHRKAVLDEIRLRLDSGRPCRLVSTQCVEAGVDVDFPVAFRAWGPLDSIAQVAGRCNRHGSMDRRGTVQVFVPELEGGRAYPDRAYEQAAAVAEDMLKRAGRSKLDIHDPALFQKYYKKLYSIRGIGEDAGDELASAIRMQHFRKVADSYHVIEARDAVNVLVPYGISDGDFERLCCGPNEGCEGARGWACWLSLVRPRAISLFRPRDDDPRWGWLVPLSLGGGRGKEEWFRLSWNKETEKKENYYDPRLGLVFKESERHWIA